MLYDPNVAETATVSRTAPATAFGTIDFLGLHFRRGEQKDILDHIGGRQQSETFSYVLTPNVDHVVRLQHSRSDLWPVYRRAWLTLCDSRILARLARNSGLQLPIVTGSDLTAALFRDVIRSDDRVAILGGSEEAVEQLRRTYGLTDVVHHNPPMGFIADDAALSHATEFLIDAKARYSFLAVGSPQQEILACRVERSGKATGIGLCVGASLEFLTGGQVRAPRFVQRLSLEWLFRLLSQPGRLWRRYLVDGPMIFQIYRNWGRAA
ncbi:WecB/TagA/CpsF family glycosyltransferase [Sphingomonas sp. SUN019]|uniref:WecB/TagA/CpsF family glycosyltransferase n=1 Tax=Sphingomonas sp. SUN019 TaxID=2937788 RepID=UPI002164634A|nr:WecB/TagA/CpsF family glycosyltransferase [Sphingomonas sp. SUN019]UVO51474.1 WecB/TagA/CpsF family glycosyltransferase [Sphingomonas sp. SUN019]